MADDDPKVATADGVWNHAMTEAIRMFGLRLGCRNNQEAVARALVEIARIVDEGGDVEITVKRVASNEENEAAKAYCDLEIEDRSDAWLRGYKHGVDGDTMSIVGVISEGDAADFSYGYLEGARDRAQVLPVEQEGYRGCGAPGGLIQ
jgi:hypothetical protein